MSDFATDLQIHAYTLLSNGDKFSGEKMKRAAAEITRLTEALASSEEARRAERAAVVRECARKAANLADLYDDEFGEDRVSDMIWGLHRDIEALATDADNAALDKLLREARKEGARSPTPGVVASAPTTPPPPKSKR